jgi:hypothetical protein
MDLVMNNHIVPQVSKRMIYICVWPYVLITSAIALFYVFGFNLREKISIFYYISLFFVFLGFIVGLTISITTVKRDWKTLIFGFFFFGGGIVFLNYLIDQPKYYSHFFKMYIIISGSFVMLIGLAGLLAVHLKQLFRGD